MYIDKQNTSYIRTQWGFEKAEKHNLRIALRRIERQYDQLNDNYQNLKYDYDQLLQRKTGLVLHLESINEFIKTARKEKGFLKKHLKEVLDKNLALEKRMQRLLRQEDNQQQQIEKLKKTKENLLEQNTHLLDKNKQHKKQISDLQKALEQKSILQSSKSI